MPPLDVLKNLQDRITALERQLADPPGTDTLQPNVITVANDGTLGADFTGHVHAQGLDLDASSISTPPDADRIRWLRTSDGAWVAALFGEYVPGVPGVLPPSIVADFVLSDPDSAGARSAVLSLVYNNGSSTEVDATATFGGFTKARTIISSDGASSFLQLPTPQQVALQLGVALVAVANDGGAGTAYQIPLTSAWPAQHTVFAAGIFNTQTSATASRVLASQPGADLAHGRVDVSSTVAQNVNFWWLSLGH